jgi:hypothetical protein
METENNKLITLQNGMTLLTVFVCGTRAAITLLQDDLYLPLHRHM